MHSRDETTAIIDAMNYGAMWNQAESIFPYRGIYEHLTVDECMEKAVERWMELGRMLGYTFKRSTHIGNSNRRIVRMVCKGERGEVEIKQGQCIDYLNSEHEHWDVAVYVGEDLALELEINPCGGMQKAAYIIDMMCEYVGCARKTESML